MITHTAKAMLITVSDMYKFVPLFKMILKMKSVVVLQKKTTPATAFTV